MLLKLCLQLLTEHSALLARLELLGDLMSLSCLRLQLFYCLKIYKFLQAPCSVKKRFFFFFFQWGIFECRIVPAHSLIQSGSTGVFHIQGWHFSRLTCSKVTGIFHFLILVRNFGSWGGIILFLLSSLVSDVEMLPIFQPCPFIWHSSWISIVS